MKIKQRVGCTMSFSSFDFATQMSLAPLQQAPSFVIHLPQMDTKQPHSLESKKSTPFPQEIQQAVPTLQLESKPSKVNVNFNSKLQAYSYVLIELYKLKQFYKNNDIENCIEKIKRAFENHEQNYKVVCGYLEELIKKLTEPHQKILQNLIIDISGSDYKQSQREKFENPLARRAESELFTLLLKAPTPAMMTAVKRVSLGIIEAMKSVRYYFHRSVFLKKDFDPENIISLAKIFHSMDPESFLPLMELHRQFALTTAQTYDCNPVKLHSITRNSELFCADGVMKSSDRGRLDQTYNFTKDLGIMLSTQNIFSTGLTATFATPIVSWCPDAKGRVPNMKSAYVIDMIENDAVYVSGPSGTTSCILEVLASWVKFESEAEKQNYLMAIATFIVATGYHSLHEVLEVGQYALQMVPRYNVTVPDLKNVAPAPNYNEFFSQQIINNPGFLERREIAWKNYLEFFNSTYAPAIIKDYKKEKTKIFKPDALSVQRTGLFYHPVPVPVLEADLSYLTKNENPKDGCCVIL